MRTNETELTVAEFFNLADELVEEELDEVSEEEEASRLQLMKERIQTELKGYTVPDAFYEMVFKHVIDLLNIEIPDLLTEAWSKYEELSKYRDEKKYPPADTFYSPLVGHKFTSTHNPLIQPTINRISLGSITITAEFALNLDGVLLQIKAGKIEGFTIGKCLGSGRLAIQGVEMVKKDSKPWSFPKMYMLPTPIQIPDLKQIPTAQKDTPTAAVSPSKNPSAKK